MPRFRFVPPCDPRTIDFGGNFARLAAAETLEKIRGRTCDENEQDGRRVAGRGVRSSGRDGRRIRAGRAANYPNKPIRVVVPFAAGGGNDIFARLVGNKLSEILGQPVINENKPGAGGRIAAEYVMNQPHDGYTLFVGASGVMSIAAAAYPNLSYHPTKTFIPLSMIANFPLIAGRSRRIIRPRTSRNWSSGRRRIPTRRTTPRPRRRSPPRRELLKLKSGMPGQMIPYKSSNEMILSVMQGQTLFAISDGPPAIPQIKAGKVRALAVTGS